MTQQQIRNSFVFLNTNAEEIFNIIPSCVHRKIADIIAPALSSLINEAVASGSYPYLFKVAGVTSIQKSGPKCDFENYRPISVLPFLNKVFDRALHSRFSKFYHESKVIYEDQYGFFKNRSTTDAILKIAQGCYSALNSEEHLISVFLDFSKAFYAICQDILIKKLELNRKRSNLLSLFKSYLSNGPSMYKKGQKSSLIVAVCKRKNCN